MTIEQLDEHVPNQSRHIVSLSVPWCPAQCSDLRALAQHIHSCGDLQVKLQYSCAYSDCDQHVVGSLLSLSGGIMVNDDGFWWKRPWLGMLCVLPERLRCDWEERPALCIAKSGAAEHTSTDSLELCMGKLAQALTKHPPASYNHLITPKTSFVL